MDFEDLYRQYAPGVYQYILALSGDPRLAEDVTSETFIKAIEASDRFEYRSSVATWLYSIAKNTLVNARRRAKPVAVLSEDLMEATDAEGEVVRKATALELHQAIHRLEEPYKEVFSLRVYSELSFADIAGLFGKTPSWARVTFFRAKTKVREDLQSWNVE